LALEEVFAWNVYGKQPTAGRVGDQVAAWAKRLVPRRSASSWPIKRQQQQQRDDDVVDDDGNDDAMIKNRSANRCSTHR
jgi:hypothetical protein